MSGGSLACDGANFKILMLWIGDVCETRFISIVVSIGSRALLQCYVRGEAHKMKTGQMISGKVR